MMFGTVDVSDPKQPSFLKSGKDMSNISFSVCSVLALQLSTRLYGYHVMGSNEGQKSAETTLHLDVFCYFL